MPVVPSDEDDPCWFPDPLPVEEESDPVEADESSLLEEDPWSEALDEDASEEWDFPESVLSLEP